MGGTRGRLIAQQQLSTKLALVLLAWAGCVAFQHHGVTAADIKPKSFDLLYEEGVQAYLEERWTDCVSHLEDALAAYKRVKDVTVQCRMKCQKDAEEAAPMFAENVEGLHHDEKMVRKTLCLLKCNKVVFKDKQPAVPKKVAQSFQELKPYEYLQLCYFQKNLPQKAASAVFTFLVTNPDHETMLTNLKFYTALPEVNSDDIVNLEAPPFVGLYVHGSDAYKNQDFPAVIQNIEESLVEYLHAEERCRAFCEGPFDQGWFPDYTSSVANHFTYCLKCKRKCASQLNTLNGERHEDLLPSHYHYLQFAYFKVGKLEKACEAVASYLLFFPADETMLENKAYYQTMPKVTPELFVPRQEALMYVKRQEYEHTLMSFIETEFIFDEDVENAVADSELLKSKHPRGLLLPYNPLSTKSSDVVISTDVEEHETELKIMKEGGMIKPSKENQLNGMSECIENDSKNTPSILKQNKEAEHDILQSTHSELVSKRTAAETSSECIAKTNTQAKEVSKSKKYLETSKKTQPTVGSVDFINVEPRLEGPNKEYVQTMAKKKVMSKEMKKSVAELQESPYQGITLVAGYGEIVEPHRFVAEGFATDDECKSLVRLANTVAVPGDGYSGNSSPHTKLERFDGLSVGRVALMTHMDVLQPQLLKTYMQIGERGKNYIERYFNLKTPLYFNYAHLVCRTSLMTGNNVESLPHLSHPVHADNCDTQTNGKCIKTKRSFEWRDYSAVIFLNEDFEGGEFFFSKNATESGMQVAVKPKCGRMVGFSSGSENLHGVQGVRAGKRCVMGLWFTLDPAHNEQERMLAQRLSEQNNNEISVVEQMVRDLKMITNFS